jgi:hypothetical protein
MARKPGVARKEVKIDCYSGDSNVESYITQFKLAAQRNGWSESEWASELVLRLRGDARNLILTDDKCEVTSFRRICKKLKERFGALDTPTWHVAQLRGRKRKEKETVPELLQWMTGAGAKAYPDIPMKTRDRVLLDFFVGALTEESQRRYVLDDEPAGMAEAAKIALRWEAIHKTEDQWKRDAQSVRDVNAHKRYVRAVAASVETADSSAGVTEPRVAAVTTKTGDKSDKLACDDIGTVLNSGLEKIANMIAEALKSKATNGPPKTRAEKNPDGSPNRANGSTKCFNCGKAGHLARDCRSAKTCNVCGGKGHMAKDCATKPNRSEDLGNAQGHGHQVGETVGPRN